jgi:Flp pilus assembly protein TadD
MRFIWTCVGLLLIASTGVPAQDVSGGGDPLPFVKKGIAQNAQGNFPQALDSFNHALELNPHDSAAFEGRGETHLGLGDEADAITDFTRSLKIEPGNETAFFHRGLAESRQGSYPAAITDFNQALNLTSLTPVDAPNILFERGRAKYLQGDPKNAMTDLNQAVALKPAMAAGYLFRGFAQDDESQFDAAAADFATAAKHGAPTAPLWFWEAEMEGHHDDAANAKMPSLLGEALAGHPDAWISDLANLLAQKTTESQIQSDLQNAKPGDHRDAEASFFVGLSREYSGDTAGAKQSYQRIIALGDASSYYTIEARRHLAKLSP